MNNRERLGIDPNHTVESNPDFRCPDEILAQQVGIRVQYMNFEGIDRTGLIEVHQDVAEDVIDFFAFAYEIGFPLKHVVRASLLEYKFDDNKLMSDNVSSGFNYRYIEGSTDLSLHALGLAIDVNPKLNPYMTYDSSGKVVSQLPPRPMGSYDPREAGTFTKHHELVVFMRERGWEWGGDWKKESGRVDLHHFQKPA
jgi:peptidoglycan LD-endopeptidase CwlK